MSGPSRGQNINDTAGAMGNDHAFITACEPDPVRLETSAHAVASDAEVHDFAHIGTRVGGKARHGAEFFSVCGEDQREPVTDTTRYPFSAICFLELTFWDDAESKERSYIGTGFLYSSQVVYTAGHCVHETFGYATRIRVFPGRNASQAPFGSLTSSQYYAPPEWVANHSPQFDYGAILLPEPGFMHTQFIGMEARPKSALVGTQARTAGYPGDKAYATPWQVFGSIDDVRDQQFLYMIDTMGGQSGSPVFTAEPSGFGNHFALGIHCYGGCPNASTRVIQQMLSRLPK